MLCMILIYGAVYPLEITPKNRNMTAKIATRPCSSKRNPRGLADLGVRHPFFAYGRDVPREAIAELRLASRPESFTKSGEFASFDW